MKRALHKEIRNDNTQKVKNILDYATENKFILELNEKDKDGWYPLLDAISCYNNNIEMVKLLIDYANKNKIILELNKKNTIGLYPLLKAIYYDNIEIVKLLID